MVLHNLLHKFKTYAVYNILTIIWVDKGIYPTGVISILEI